MSDDGCGRLKGRYDILDLIRGGRVALSNLRVLFNYYSLRRRGVELGEGAWIPGRVELALAGRAAVSIGRRVFIPRSVELLGSDEGRIEIGDDVTIDSGARLHVANRATLRVGDRVGIGPYNILNAFDDLSIGDDTMFGPFINVNCADHGMEVGTPMREQTGSYGPVSIGRDCWLGAMVVVTRGVSIGDGAVVGAGSIVTRDIPPYTIAAGAPCFALKERR